MELAQCNMFQKLLDRFDYDDEPEAVEDTKKEEATTSPSLSQPTLYVLFCFDNHNKILTSRG